MKGLLCSQIIQNSCEFIAAAFTGEEAKNIMIEHIVAAHSGVLGDDPAHESILLEDKIDELLAEPELERGE